MFVIFTKFSYLETEFQHHCEIHRDIIQWKQLFNKKKIQLYTKLKRRELLHFKRIFRQNKQQKKYKKKNNSKLLKKK